jgi:hypothetical protein
MGGLRPKKSNPKIQVAPDVILAKRGQTPVAINMKVSERRKAGGQLYHLYKGGDLPCVFDELPLRLEGSKEKRSVPKIVYGGGLFTLTEKGTDTPPGDGDGYQATSLFSFTSKMACPSFSIPSGPTYEMGTCIAANLKRGHDGELIPGTNGRVKGRKFICDECYALKNAYTYPNTTISQAARYHWVAQQLEADMTGKNLAAQLAGAIKDFATNSTMRGAGDSVGNRQTCELGRWKDGRIVVPVFYRTMDTHRGDYTSTPVDALPTRLDQRSTGFTNTTEFFQHLEPPEGAVTGFFRIHDSGDFSIGSGAFWLPYIRAWTLVARAFPYVMFWAPTRMWRMKSHRNMLVEAQRLAPNLIVRPSALHLEDRAPLIESYSAGTTVARVIARTRGLRPTVDTDDNPTWSCPVRIDRDSCMGLGCRTCWILRLQSVSYHWH